MVRPVDCSRTHFPIPWTQPLNTCSDRIAKIVEDYLNPFLHSCKTSLKSMNWSRILCSSLLLFNPLAAAGGQECRWNVPCREIKNQCVYYPHYDDCVELCLNRFVADEGCLSHCSKKPKEKECRWNCLLEDPQNEACILKCNQEITSLKSTLRGCVERLVCLPTILSYESQFMTDAYVVQIISVKNDTHHIVDLNVIPRFIDAGITAIWENEKRASSSQIICESLSVSETQQKIRGGTQNVGASMLELQMPGDQVCKMSTGFPVLDQLPETSKAYCFFISFFTDKPHLKICLNKENIEQVTLIDLDTLPPHVERERSKPGLIPKCPEIELVIAFAEYEDSVWERQFNIDEMI